MPSKCELLCPVGNAEMLKAAVRSGADAVYFGGEHFNARRNAENFGDKALEEAIKYCHINGVKAYLTLNIIVGDDELSMAIDMARAAHKAGIDGLIVADIGLAHHLSKRFPKLPLHASTQLSVHSVSSLPTLKKAGFSRVVLSREMSLDSIKEFCLAAKEYDIEVEAFVHGALCMSVSGQCYLSAMLGSRSGNRGLCAGPCRLPFKAKGGTGYDLSLKDLSYIQNIEELIEAGVVSLKVEGRMKRPEYVAAAASAIRKAIDSGKPQEDDVELLKNVFSRQGFTEGYLFGKTGKEMFGIRTKDDVTSAPKTFAALHEIYRNERKRVPISAVVSLKKGEPVSLTLSDGVHTVTAIGEPPETAINRPIDKTYLEQSFSKLGGTPYYINEFTAHLEENLSLSAASLNKLRREAVEQLNNMRSAAKEIIENDITPSRLVKKAQGEAKRYCFFADASQIPKDIIADTIILPLEKDFSGVQFQKGTTYAVDVPRGIKSENAIKELLAIARQKGFTKAVCGNIAAIELCREAGLEIIGGFGLNIYNSLTAEFYRDLGVCEQVLSFEMRLGDAAKIGGNNGIICYGKLPLMLTANCPLRNGIDCKNCDKKGVLTDRLGVQFPVRCRLGFSEVFNSRPINLLDKKSELSRFDFNVFYFTDESSKEVQEILASYEKNASPKGQYTRGLYYRGVE